MIPLTELPSRLVRKARFAQAHDRLERDFARLMQTARSAPSPRSGPVIGIATFGSGGWHLVLEALLGHGLAARGARPEMLLCDMPDLPVCNERNIHSRHQERCDGCIADKRGLLDVCRMPWRGLSGLVAPDSLARARAAAGAVAADAIESYVERGWPIGQWLHVSACHYLRADAHGDTAEKVDIRRRFLVTAIVAVEAVERWLDELGPDIVIAQSGAHVVWRVAFELARARGIPVVCREMGKGGWDRHIYSLNADCMAPDLSDAWAAAKDEPLSAADDAAVERYLQDLPVHTYHQQSPVERVPPDEVRRRLNLPGGIPIAVAFTNVSWDLATAGRDVAFAGVFDWLRETIHAMPPAAHLIVRAHPAEASVLTRERVLDQIAREWPGGLPNVTVVPPETTIAATDLCAVTDLVLAYNSTVAIEAAAAGHPVVVGGNPHYRGRGFTIDVETRDEYRALLTRWAAGEEVASPVAAAAMARRYAYLFFFRYHVRMGWTTSELDPPYQLLIQSLDELAPGRNPALDEVCQAILAHRQVLLPPTVAGELWCKA
jgi:hypothetical protein